MAKRLRELYPIGEQVEIKMGEDVWLAGVVERHEHPAVWVKTVNGRFWFVTNRQRIRKTSTV